MRDALDVCLAMSWALKGSENPPLPLPAFLALTQVDVHQDL